METGLTPTRKADPEVVANEVMDAGRLLRTADAAVKHATYPGRPPVTQLALAVDALNLLAELLHVRLDSVP
jgi:hypothetical protein